jgi:hypothetical protein
VPFPAAFLGAVVQSPFGAIRSAARLRIEDCTISGNAAARGGGIYIKPAGSQTNLVTVLDIQNSRISGNQATGSTFC